MHTVEKKEMIPVIIPVTQFRSRERRKLQRERESPIWPTLGVCASGTQRSRQPVLPNATENPVLSEPYLSLAIMFNTWHDTHFHI